MRERGQGRSEERDALLRAISGRDTAAQHPIVERTRRAVRVADQSRRELASQGRRSAGVALFVLGAALLVLAPAIWGSVDDLLGGEHIGDLPAQVALLASVLLISVMAALAAGWRTQVSAEDLARDQQKVLR